MNNGNYQDIRETGPVGLKGLNYQSQQLSPEAFAALYYAPRGRKQAVMFNLPQERSVGLSMGQDFGRSKYDKYARSLYDIENLNEIRATNQTALDKLGAGFLKMLGTAVTTFLDNTVGLAFGLTKGAYNLVTGKEEGFWRGVWDNEFSNAMADAQEKMEEALPNYMTNWEQNASVLDRMFSGEGAANFWGNTVLKNAGFTLGAAASMYATAGLGSLTGASTVLQNAGRAGKYTQWAARTFIASAGESTIETLNAIRDNERLMEQNLQIGVQAKEAELDAQYQADIARGVDPTIAQETYKAGMSRLQEDVERYRQQMKEETTAAGNAIFAGNMAVLSVSNNLQLSGLIRGGFSNTSNMLSKVMLTSEGKAISEASDVAEAMLKGTLRYTPKGANRTTARIAGRWALGTAQEGFEEGAQNIMSSTGQLYTLAKMNKYAKDNTMLGAMINPQASEELVNIGKAMHQAYAEQFGAANGQGWEEVMAGLITGALGIGGMHRNQQGKIRPTWHGGLKEAYDDVMQNVNAQNAYADMLNNAIESQEFGKNARHAVEQMVIKSKQDQALSEGNVLSYKNLEIQQAVSNALFAADMGNLDGYLAIYEQLAKGVSDEDVKQIRLLAKESNTGTSALDSMTDDEIKAMYQDKAKSTQEKIETAVKTYRDVLNSEGKKYSDDVREFAMKELTFLNTLIVDTDRRKEEIENEKQSILNQIQGEQRSMTPLEQERVRQLDKAIAELTGQRQELSEKVKEYKAHPEKLGEEIHDSIRRYRKQELYKAAENAIASYKNANTLKDVIDIYTNSPVEDREKVLTQAISQAEGDTRALLKSFQDYVSSVGAMESFINKEFAPNKKDTAEQAQKKEYMRAIYQQLLNTIVDEMLEDSNPVITRESLKDKLTKRKEELFKSLSEVAEDASYVKRAEDGSLELAKEIDPEYIENYLDEKEESHQRIREDKRQQLQDAFLKFELLQEMIGTLDKMAETINQVQQLQNSGQKKVKVKESSFDSSESSKGKGTGKPKQSTGKGPKLAAKLTPYLEEKKIVSEKTGVTYIIAVPKEGANPSNVQGFFDAQNVITKQIDAAKEELKNTSDQATIKRIINSLLEIPKTRVLGNKRYLALEEVFIEYKEYLPKKEPQQPTKPNKQPTLRGEHLNEEGQLSEDSADSLRGNNYTAYDKKSLNKDKRVKLVEFQETTLKEYGKRMQDFIDNVLHSIIEKNPDIAVHYIMSRDEESTVVFLGFKASEIPAGIDLSKAVRIEATDEEGNNDAYILWGNMGYYSDEEDETGDADIQKQSFENIHSYLLEARKKVSAAHYFVSSKYTNKVKDQTAGATVKIGQDDSEAVVRDLRELLASRNPHNLGIDDIAWVFVEGKEGSPTFKQIGNVEDAYSLGRNAKPGQLYMYLPSSNGVMIPVYMETIFYNELEDAETPLAKAIEKRVRVLADPEATEDEKVLAISELNDYLVFGENHRLHYNTNSDTMSPNTIRMTLGGFSSTVVELNSEASVEDNMRSIYDALGQLNPRVNITTRTISSNPSFYLESGVLKTDIGLLGTVNSQVFVYPVQIEGAPEMVSNKKVKKEPVSYVQHKTREYLNGEYILYDGVDFYNKKGEVLQGEERKQAQILHDVKEGLYKPIVVGNEEYYDIDGTMYASNGHGGFVEIDDETRQKVLKNGKEQSAVAKRKKATRKKLATMDEKDQTAAEILADEEGKPKQKTTKSKRNFVNSDELSNLKSEKDLQDSEKSSNFASKLTTFYDDADDATQLMIDAAQEEAGAKTLGEFAEVLVSSGVAINDSQPLTSDNVEQLIEDWRHCYKH